ncbi:conjugative transposon protein TraM [Chryseobacterium arthrosphaerae]|uniref:conjugative transposon protein TraM n=1 Tax=Chryseobacterium arthrosphaerae TaxID=651561 RepID=UPI002414E2C3|nr:conjugative transposon protein TraM [Chryseobacterium arthrosphaerae]MDG4655266.1 conjugative transposon protein TraM [Chryseobacterium arthrosphaerae]
MKRIITAISLIIAFSVSAQTSIKTDDKTEISSDSLPDKQIKARMLTSGKIQTGSSLTLILSEPTSIAGVSTKKGQTISGIAREQDGRLYIDVSTIKIDGKVYPVRIKVYSENGIEGFGLNGRTPNAKKPIEISNTGMHAIVMIYS